MARIHFIIDPQETKVGSKWPYEQKKIEDQFQDFEIHIVRGRNHAELLATSACRKSAELIVCVGGDSTVNEVVNALYSFGKNAPAITIHPEFHTGSFSKSLSWRSSFLDFLNAFLKSEVQEFQMDLGKARFTGEFGQKIERVFVNSFGFGFSSYLLYKLRNQNPIRLNRFQFLKLISSSLPFFRLPKLKIQTDENISEAQPTLTGFVHNTPYFREGIKLSPDSQVNDGIFEFTLVKRAAWPTYWIASLPFYTGKTSGFKFIQRYQIKKLNVDALHKNRQVRIDFDGECRGYLPAELEVLERGLRVLR